MNIYLLLYICRNVLPIARRLLPIAYCLLPTAYCLLPVAYLSCLQLLDRPEVGFMRHGHEMLWFLRGSFSESELPLSYNAKVTNARTQLIGSEINLLNKV